MSSYDAMYGMSSGSGHVDMSSSSHHRRPKHHKKWRQQQNAQRAKAAQQDQEEDDEDAMEEVEFADYAPAKLKVGGPHPDPVVENASLAAVEPPDLGEDPLADLPEEIVEENRLSGLQLESIAYANYRFAKSLADGSRCGFFIGDGAGMGKGRQLAGIIAQQSRRGHGRHVWISVSNDLKFDAERDLADILGLPPAPRESCGVDRHADRRLPVYALSKLSYERLSRQIRDGVVFLTYAALIAKNHKGLRRVEQLIDWCGGADFEGCVMFDESHKAKNLQTQSGKPTKVAEAVMELQKALPRAKIVYCSATGASEPRHLAYMARLGLWDGAEDGAAPFDDFDSFKQIVDSRGVGMMELIAMHLKQQGALVCRALSFQHCTFELVDGVMDAHLEKVYDRAVELWAQLRLVLLKMLGDKTLKNPFDTSSDDSATGATMDENDVDEFGLVSSSYAAKLHKASKQTKTKEKKTRPGQRHALALLLGGPPALLQGPLRRREGPRGHRASRNRPRGRKVRRRRPTVHGGGQDLGRPRRRQGLRPRRRRHPR
mmetsp:Transcript_13450/g.43812  ORF Transcript_13450/g.43812 Transcript_13450/m.43812 type:complete len:544 (+) Transcript_13450:67-1698(+)